jgi:two-component system response regulator DctR
MTYKTVYVVSDDPAIRDSLSELIASAGLRAKTFPVLESWLEAVSSKSAGCLILDAAVRDFTLQERLERLTATCSRLPVLVLVDRGDVPIAMSAVKRGVFDILEKPLRDTNLLERIKIAAVQD